MSPDLRGFLSMQLTIKHGGMSKVFGIEGAVRQKLAKLVSLPWCYVVLTKDITTMLCIYTTYFKS